MSDEFTKALIADGEKLRALTGEEHGPFIIEDDMIDIIGLHKQMTRHLFPAFSSQDERFLALALCGEAGELANMIKKRWRDGTGANGAKFVEEIRDEIADIRVYLELLAQCFDIAGAQLDERVQAKLAKVAAKHGVKT